MFRKTVCGVVTGLLRIWFRTLIFKTPHGAILAEPGVILFWHAHIFSVIAWLVVHNKSDRCVALVSASEDGQKLACVLKRLGFTVVEGSSSRYGFEALLALRSLKYKNHWILITPDGPKGPARTCKPGFASLAQMHTRYIHAVSLHTTNAWNLNSWDRAQIPKPFSKIGIQSTPIQLSEKSEIINTAERALHDH